MCKEIYATSDIWLGAVLLAETNAELIDVHLSKNGNETVTFSFQGGDVSRVAKAYGDEEAIANVSRLRREINHLRYLIFQAKEN